MKLAPTLVIAATAALLSAPVLADSAHQGMNHGETMAMNHAAAAPMSEGTVKKLDKGNGKLTIAHGPLVNLGMPGMTMVFRVQDEAMLDEVKAGDKIRFTADRVNGAFTVTALEPAK